MALTRLPLNAATGTLAQLNTAVTDADVQPILVSGTNIKTVGGTSLLGSGDITISNPPQFNSGII